MKTTCGFANQVVFILVHGIESEAKLKNDSIPDTAFHFTAYPTCLYRYSYVEVPK